MSWKEDKNLGTWPFIVQVNKPSYNEGNLISDYSDHVWKTAHDGVPVTVTHLPCGYWPSKTPASEIGSDGSTIDVCEDVYIGSTASSLQINEYATLTVIDPVPGAAYSWRIKEDPDGLDMGSLVGFTEYTATYKAPASNEYCLKAPLIILSTMGYDCDEIGIAITYGCMGDAYAQITPCEHWYEDIYRYRIHHYDCCGTLNYSQQMGIGNEAPCIAKYHTSLATYGCNEDGIGDKRSELLKALGCCPEALPFRPL